MERPWREQRMADGGGERAVEPGCCRLEQFGTAGHELLAAELAKGGPAELQRLTTPEVGAEQAEREIGLGAEVAHRAVPGIEVAQSLELGCRDRWIGREHCRAGGADDAGGERSVDVLDAAGGEVAGEFAVGGAADEQRMPARQEFEGEAWHAISARADGATSAVIALAQQHAPSVLREHRTGDERVDPGADDDGVVRCCAHVISRDIR